MRFTRTLAGAATVWLAIAILSARSANAVEPPPNDDLSSATVISTLPFQLQEDTRGATVAASDPLACLGSGGGYTRTVWYSYRPTTSEPLKLAILSTGTAPYGFVVLDTTNGGLEPVGCSTSGSLVFVGRAGHTYAIMTAVLASEAERTDSLFVLEAFVQQHVPFTFEPPAAQPGQTVAVLANVTAPGDVPCYPIDATLLFSADSSLIERNDQAVFYSHPSDRTGLFNPLMGSASGFVYNPPVPIVQRWVLPSIAPGRYATYWQCNEPFIGPELWRAADFVVLPAELPPTDRQTGAAVAGGPAANVEVRAEVAFALSLLGVFALLRHRRGASA